MRTQTQPAPQANDRVGFRTTCGRKVQVGLLALGGAERPARRVSLDIGPSSGDGGGALAALTPAEARRLAAALLSRAAAGEQPVREVAPDGWR